MARRSKATKKKWLTPKLLQHEISFGIQEVHTGSEQCDPYGYCDTSTRSICPM